MRCPKCGVKNTDIKQHIRLYHPQCVDSEDTSDSSDVIIVDTSDENKKNKDDEGCRSARCRLYSKSQKQPRKRRFDSPSSDSSPECPPTHKKIKIKGHKSRTASPKPHVDSDESSSPLLEESTSSDENPLPVKKSPFKVKSKRLHKVKSTVARRKKSDKGKQQRKCPKCPISVINLARHLACMHGMAKSEALMFLRTNRKIMKGPGKTPFKRYRSCPYSDCRSEVKHLSQHLRVVHKLNPIDARAKSHFARVKEMCASSGEDEMQKEEVPFKTKRDISRSWHARASNKSSRVQKPSPSKPESELETPSEPEPEPEPEPGCSGIVPAQDAQAEETDIPGSSEQTLVSDSNFNPTLISPLMPQALNTKHQQKSSNPKSKLTSKSKPNKKPSKNRAPWWRRKENTIQNWRQVKELRDFHTFLKSTERNLNAIEAEQRTVHVFNMWKMADYHGAFRFGLITNADVIGKRWLEQVKTTKKPGTIVAYLASYGEFLSYLFLKNKIKRYQFTQLKTRRDTWRKALTKSIRDRRLELIAQESSNPITGDHIAEFQNSGIVTDVKRILKETTNSTNVYPEEWLLCVGYLALRIAMTNAQRCGAILGLNLQAFANRKTEGNKTIISVLKHKTGIRGPCNLVIDKETEDMLVDFLRVRRLLSNIDSLRPTAGLFVDTTGRNLTHSRLNQIINSAWKKSGLKNRVTFTRIRKAVVTAFHEKKPEAVKRLAGHMTHLASTASTYYNLAESRAKAVKTSTEICEVMGFEKIHKPDSPPDVEVSPEEENPQRKSSDESKEEGERDPETLTPMEDPQPSTSSEIQPCLEPESNTTSDVDYISQTSSSTHRRRTFSEEDANIIHELFKDYIKTNRPILQRSVMTHLQNTIEGRDLLSHLRPLFGKSLKKKLADRIRTFRRQWLKRQDF